MAIDTLAIIAILLKEPEAASLAGTIESGTPRIAWHQYGKGRSPEPPDTRPFLHPSA